MTLPLRKLALAAAVSLATLLGAALLWKFRGAAALFAISLAVAAALRPTVEALEARLGRAGALVVTYMAGLTLLGVFAYVALHGVLVEADRGVERLRGAYDSLLASARRASSDSMYGFILQRLPPAAAIFEALGGAGPGALLERALGFTANAMDLIGHCAIVVALSAYWSASRESFERLWLSLLPAAARTRARETWRAVEQAVGAHLRSEIGQSLLAVLLLGLMFHVAHLPTPMLPALAAGVFRLVPFFGVLAAAAGALAAGAAVSPAVGALSAAYTLLVLSLLDRVMARHLFQARRYSPALTVFLIVALVDAYGVLGVLIASPLAATVQVLVVRLIATRPRRSLAPAGVAALASPQGTLADIERRIARARQRLLLMPPDETAQLASVVSRLDALAGEARRVTEATAP